MSLRRALIVCLAALCAIAPAALAQPSCPNPIIVQTSGANPSCASQPVTLDAGSGWTSYQWSNGATTRTISVSPASTTTYTVTATDAQSCSATSMPYEVMVYSTMMPPTITITPPVVCATATARIDSNPSGWGWNSGTVWTVTNAVITHQDNQSVDFTPTGAGPVTVDVTATDANGCPGTATATAQARPAPVAVLHLSMPATCPGSMNSASLEQPDPNDPYSTWSTVNWSVTNGTITWQSGYSVTFTTDPGGQPATVSVVATDSYGCSATASSSVGVRTVPPPVIHLSMPATCPGSPNSASIDPPANDPYGYWSTVNWSVTNGTIIWQGGNSMTFTTDPGGQPATVSVTATDGPGCTNSASASVDVRTVPPPVIHLSMPATCPGSPNSASIDPPANDPYGYWSTVNWSVTNGTIIWQGGNSMTFTTDPGGQPATVHVTATDGPGCVNSASASVDVRTVPPPVIHLSMPATCPGSPNSASIDPPANDPYGYWWTVNWSVTNGTIIWQGGNSMTFTTDPGGQPATVSVTATDGPGCTNSASASVGVRTVPPPVIHLSMPATCPGSPNSASIDPPANDPYGYWSTVTWSVTNGTINWQSGNSMTFTTDPGGQPATVHVTATDGPGCVNSASMAVGVRVLAPPVITTESPDVCPTSEIHASVAPPSEPYSYWTNVSWTATNARITSQNTNSSDIFAVADGTGPVTLTSTVTDAYGCTVTSTKTVPLTSNPPTAVFGGPQTVCAGARFTVTANDPNYPGRYYSFASPNAQQWSTEGCCAAVFDAGAAGTTIDIYVTSANTGTARCDSWGHTTIAVVAPPVATVTASGPTALCPGGSVTLTAGAATSYSWSNGATTQSITVSQPGSYIVTVANAGCSATSVPVDVTALTPTTPTITASGPTTFCAGGSVTLTASAGASYSWSNGATTQAITVSAAGNYTVTVTGANGCVAASAATAVTVNPAPKPSIFPGGPTTFCAGGSVLLSASSGFASYLWSNGATTQSITVNTAGSWTVTGTTAAGCATASNPVTTTISVPQVPAIVAPVKACPNQFFNAHVTPPAPGSYQQASWGATNISDFHSNGSWDIDFKPNGGGDVVITFTITDWYGCTSSSTKTVQVVRPPVPLIQWGGGICPGATGTATVTNGPFATYAWYAYNATIVGASNGPSVSFTTNPGVTYVDLTIVVTDEMGCSNQWTHRAGITTITPFVQPSGSPAMCPGGSVTLTADAGYAAYNWSNGATTRSITVSNAGSYTVTVTDANGCTGTSAPKNVTVRSVQTPVVTPSGPTTFCSGYSVQLTGSSGFASYLWSNGATTSQIFASQTGDYSVTATDFNGCTATSAPVHVTVNPTPVATLTPNGYLYICQGSTRTLRAGPDGMSYHWSTGATTQTIDVTQAGTYSVYVTTASGCSSQSQYVTFTQWGNPVPAVTASGPTTFCAGGSVTLTAPDFQSSYLWSNGATTRSITVGTSGSYTVTVTSGPESCTNTSAPVVVTANTAATPTISGATSFCAGGSTTLTATAGSAYAWSNGATTRSITVSSAGNYSVTVTDANGCSAQSAPAAVTVNTPVTPTISGATSFCAGSSTTLTASAGASYAWSNGATTQSITVSSAGSYSVTVTDANGCSAQSAPAVVTVNTPATPTITGATSFCAGDSTTLTASAGASYSWSNGATTSSITVSSAGNYTVTVTYANGCSAQSALAVVTINTPVTTTITGATSFCAGGSTTLTASAGASYSWSSGATTQSITVNAAGNYSVTVTDANGCSAQSAPAAVTINTPATPTITGTTSFCAGGSTTLTASAGASYSWSNGATTQSITVNAGGNYTVTVTDANGCSAQSAPAVVTVNTPATPTITGATSFCAGGSTTLTASAGASYSWSSGATTQSITVNAGGNYTVTVTDANGCSAQSAPAVVTVNTPATPTISGATSFCAGGSTTLTASAGASYSWSSGATTQSITVNAAGNYSVTVTDANGCSAQSAPAVVTINTPVTPTITGATSFCAGGSTTLTASAGASYSWSNGATMQSITVNAGGNYTVTVTDANGCSAQSAPAVVTVNTPTTPTITGATSFCAGGSTTLTASAGASYSWSNGATTQSITVNAGGNYTVTVTDANGCSAQSAPAVVTVNTPVTPTISGATSFCTGGSTTLTSSVGASYLWTNGATTRSITVSAGGTFRVTVTDANGCSAQSAPAVVTVNTPATPTISPAGAVAVCPGTTTTLTASAGSGYLWSNGATTQSISAGAGNYSVTVTDANGCSAQSAVKNVAAKVQPTAAVSGGATICAGGSTTVNATLTGTAPFNLTWSDGFTQTVSTTSVARTVTPASTRTYTITSISDANCSGTATGGATVTVNTLPAFTQPPNQSIARNTSATLTVTPSGTAPFTYQWYKGNAPSTSNQVATTQTYVTPHLSKGTYTYWVKVTNSCGATSSATITITVP